MPDGNKIVALFYSEFRCCHSIGSMHRTIPTEDAGLRGCDLRRGIQRPQLHHHPIDGLQLGAQGVGVQHLGGGGKASHAIGEVRVAHRGIGFHRREQAIGE